MLRLPLLALFFCLIGSLSSQTIVITFESTLNEALTPLDSIRVMNLTTGGDTTIYFPDNVLVLDGVTGLQEMAAQAPVLRNQPNPFHGGTDILVSTRNSGQAVLTVHDATGHEVAVFESTLAAGQHRFRYTTASTGMHLLTVLQGGERATHRLVALTGQANEAGLTYAGSYSTGGAAKSDRSLFTWTPGDALRYIGYAADGGIVHSAAIDEVPVATATRTFELFAGLACPESPTVTDIDGNVYRTVQIGGQCWMAENLASARYRNGSVIPNVTDNTAWVGMTSRAWCNYNNDPNSGAVYGKLYNWYAAGNAFMCPQGWHLPTDIEWRQLESTLGMLTGSLGVQGVRGIDQNVGGKMKSTVLWSSPNSGANNESGFFALPGGYRNYLPGTFVFQGGMGMWWSATTSNEQDVWYRELHWQSGGIARYGIDKRFGFSVRCIKD